MFVFSPHGTTRDHDHNASQSSDDATDIIEWFGEDPSIPEGVPISPGTYFYRKLQIYD